MTIRSSERREIESSFLGLDVDVVVVHTDTVAYGPYKIPALCPLCQHRTSSHDCQVVDSGLDSDITAGWERRNQTRGLVMLVTKCHRWGSIPIRTSNV